MEIDKLIENEFKTEFPHDWENRLSHFKEIEKKSYEIMVRIIEKVKIDAADTIISLIKVLKETEKIEN